MERLSVPRLIISGITPAVGKSLITIGIVSQLKQRGLSVSCCVIGTNLQQAVLLKGITSRYVHVLDPNIQTQGQILESLYMASIGADILIIEGMGTLLQPIAEGEFAGGPDTYIAKTSYTPILPIFDTHGKVGLTEEYLRAISLLPDIEFISAIANRAPTNSSELVKVISQINNEFAANKLPPLLGVIPEIGNPEKLPPHGINQKIKREPLSRQYLIELSSIVSRCVDVDELIGAAKKAQTIILEDYRYQPFERKCKIAVSFDNAFGLCFQDNLSFLKFYGADIVPFSILADTGLPKGIGGLYLTGGHLTEYASELIKNRSMTFSIRAFHEQGGAIYAEGAGAAYLCKEFSLSDDRSTLPGLGIFPAIAAPGDKEEWYFKGSLLEECVLGDVEARVSGKVTGEWQVKNPERMIRCLRMLKGRDKTVLEGFSPTGQLFGTFAFLQWGTNHMIARNFVESSSVVKF